MKREIANIRVEIVSESPEARDYLLSTVVAQINTRLPSVVVSNACAAVVRRAKVSRVRKA